MRDDGGPILKACKASIICTAGGAGHTLEGQAGGGGFAIEASVLAGDQALEGGSVRERGGCTTKSCLVDKQS